MRRINISISVEGPTLREIKSVYGRSDYAVVSSVVNDILFRYLSVEYFDPEMYDPDCPEEDETYALCERCKEKSKRNKMINVNGKNLEEHCVCENCGYGHPALR